MYIKIKKHTTPKILAIVSATVNKAHIADILTIINSTNPAILNVFFMLGKV